jgi:hypothetical protein
MSKRFEVPGAFCRGSAAASVLPSGTGWRHEHRRRLLRIAAFECEIEEVPRWLRGEERRARKDTEQ